MYRIAAASPRRNFRFWIVFRFFDFSKKENESSGMVLPRVFFTFFLLFVMFAFSFFLEFWFVWSFYDFKASNSGPRGESRPLGTPPRPLPGSLLGDNRAAAPPIRHDANWSEIDAKTLTRKDRFDNLSHTPTGRWIRMYRTVTNSHRYPLISRSYPTERRGHER